MKSAFALAVGLAIAGPAAAHVVVEPASAPPKSQQDLRFVVGHGCSGQPTTQLQVQIPATLANVKPQAKPGWTMKVGRAAAGARTVTWTGELAPTQRETFVVQARLPAKTGVISLPAIQTCGTTVAAWDEPVVAGAAKTSHPAPTLSVEPAAVASRALPAGLQLVSGAFTTKDGRALYTFDFDTMVGMSHCFGDCATLYPPLIAPVGAKAQGDWTTVVREDGQRQWAYKTKPLYLYSKDAAGAAPKGKENRQWKLARP